MVFDSFDAVFIYLLLELNWSKSAKSNTLTDTCTNGRRSVPDQLRTDDDWCTSYVKSTKCKISIFIFVYSLILRKCTQLMRYYNILLGGRTICFTLCASMPMPWAAIRSFDPKNVSFVKHAIKKHFRTIKLSICKKQNSNLQCILHLVHGKHKFRINCGAFNSQVRHELSISFHRARNSDW